MTNPLDFQPVEFFHAQATPADWDAIYDMVLATQKERLPDDPPRSRGFVIQAWSADVPIVTHKAWLVYDPASPGRKIIAECRAEILHIEGNEHMCQVILNVQAGYRGQGIGKRLLKKAADFAHETQRTMLMGEALSSVPAGEAFAKAVGARPGLVMHINQLAMSEVNRNMLKAWQERAVERAADYEMLFLSGPYPEDALPQIAAIKMAMNQAPHDDLEIEDIPWSPELLKQIDDDMVKRKVTRWTFYARQKSTGELAGYTEMMWLPGQESIAQQADTGVLEQHRSHGLGRWLKAVMLDKILAERPETRFVRTGNAYSNAPMLRINDELGFRHYLATTMYQIEVEKVQQYLAQKGLA